MFLKVLFWVLLCTVVYAYLGYTLLLILLAMIRRATLITKTRDSNPDTPRVTLIIPAYNEAECITGKVNNTLALDYPKDKLKVMWITDGSTDNSIDLLGGYAGIIVMHESERRGKIHAMNRGIKMTDTPLVVFTDANTMLNPEAIRELVKCFSNSRVGCVTGEKRISASGKEKAVGAGEGLYWKYESFVKSLESETGSVMGAVGELFAIRRELYEEVPEDTLLDDLTISLQIAWQGYYIKYAPHAWGTETASFSISEELKRKVRIAAGGLQLLRRMSSLLNPLRYGLLSVKFISHKVLRWTVVPFSFPLLMLLNIAILFDPGAGILYMALFLLQCLYYLLVVVGALLKNVKLTLKAIFAPYYLFIMNYAVIKGFFHFVLGKYSVNWQKVKRG
ncbi:MAG TPA: glycosyltransferase family 2 protein [Bacteroidales bacterium]|nr:glycosyltransferase family 2 protein [Bacteroidales bacterium]